MLKLTLLVLLLAGLGLADPIVFTIGGDATGTVDGTAFTDAAFTFTVTTDTSLIESYGGGGGDLGYETPFVAGAEISIAGFAPGTFSDTEQIFVSNTFSLVGITDFAAGDLLDGANSAFTTYNLQSSIGPVPLSDLEALGSLDVFPTSLGNVTLDSATNVYFTAAPPIVTPEPETWALGAAWALFIATAGRRSFRRSRDCRR
ncbi:MAG: hypothetical protein WBL61_18340 [Bryobacteraceae bacterium]